MILKLIYTLFLGILLAAFVGMGISAFYPQPNAPDYPESLSQPAVRPLDKPAPVASEETAEQKQARLDYEKQDKEYREVIKVHNRNVSLIGLAATIIILTLGLAFAGKLHDVADGVLLGGVFTLLYSISVGFDGSDDKYRFLLVTVGLIIGFVLGYVKFIKPGASTQKT